MSIYLRNGVSDLDSIIKHYNSYSDGGSLDTPTKEDIVSTKELSPADALYQYYVNEFRDGGEVKREPSGYYKWKASLPENLRKESNAYDLYGAYLSGANPHLESDGYYPLPSRNPYNNTFLKAPHHDTFLEGLAYDSSEGYFPSNSLEGGKVTTTPIPYIDTTSRILHREKYPTSIPYAPNTYDDGGPLSRIIGFVKDKVSSLSSKDEEPKPVTHTRIRGNNTPTKKRSEYWEDWMDKALYDESKKRVSGAEIPFIPSKAILVNGHTTSTNVLDSLAKYGGMYNANPSLSEKPILSKNKYKKPEPLPLEEILGLSEFETKLGAWPMGNTNSIKDSNDLRAYTNANYLRTYGSIPSNALVRNFNHSKNNLTTHPLLDAFAYYNQGDYNRGYKHHTREVKKAGKSLLTDPKIKAWWNTSGKKNYHQGLILGKKTKK